jgi:hypothetical protein
LSLGVKRRTGKSAVGYWRGGPRGEIACGSSTEKGVGAAADSNLSTDALNKMLGAWLTTTAPTAEQMGQMCGFAGPELKSEQKWNCAPTNITARSSASMRMFRAFTGMNLVRRSLGPNGCGVKPRNGPVCGSDTRAHRYSLIGGGQVPPGLPQFRPFCCRISDFSQFCVVPPGRMRVSRQFTGPRRAP